jgi:hypothetical protein
MEDNGDFLTEVHPEFERMCVASADLTQLNQEQRPLKDGQVLFKGTYEALASRVQDGNTFVTVAEARPPPKVQMTENKEKTKKYPATLAFFFRVDSLSPEIPGHCELRPDHKPGWRFMASVKYFKEGEDYLREVRERAWSTQQDQYQTERDYITADGTLINQKWLYTAPGDEIRMKLRDGKQNIFRRDNPDQPGVPLVQPSTPLFLSNVQAVVWVTCKEEMETLPVPEGSPPDTKPVTRKVKRLVAFNTYECKGNASVSPDYDKNMCLSERKHSTNDAAKRQLVPIEDFRSGIQSPARSAYFYVASWYTTPWIPGGDPNAHGITMRRDQPVDADFSSEFNNERTATCVIRFNLFQWSGRPHTQERYIVKLVCAAKDKDRIWTSYGITELEPYEEIIKANPELPVHVEARLWESPTLNHTGNQPDTIRATEDVATVRGYYVYGIGELVPDYLRYFHGPRGLKLSREWVLKEFANWHSNLATGRETLLFTPAAPVVEKVRRNPVNVFNDKGVITALGNGQLSDPSDLRSPPLYLAYNGEAMTLFAGRHEFYVLISHHMTAEEAASWAGPTPTAAPYADGYIDNLRASAAIAKRDFYYWIFAVLKDAKRAKPKPRPQKFTMTPATITPTKRQASEEEEEHDEEEDEAVGE